MIRATHTPATNVDATAVNTIGWLSDPTTTIVVPVYQRQYRWDIGGCEQLLSDVRAAADADPGSTHFLGSILSSANTAGDARLVLIDGQQRITTIMLLVAALHHTLRADDPGTADELERVLVRESAPGRTKLVPHRAWADVFESIVLDRRTRGDRDSRFDANYAFFRSQIRPDEAAHVWRGLCRLEHVSITLGGAANAQQIFESLNSTGEPLRDHELIHNYVLMGLSHDEQTVIERDYWMPIEQATGDQIGAFWRHYLVMSTGREVAVVGERGVYDAFRRLFPRLVPATLPAIAARWRTFAGLYRTLLEPSEHADAEVGRHLGFLNTFGRGAYPLTLQLMQDHAAGILPRDAVLHALEDLQSLLLRRTVVGISTDRLVARLCRAYAEGPRALRAAMGRITPSDERTRVGLKFSDLPHPRYVLGRLADLSPTDAVDIDHIVPLSPGDDWSGDGFRRWAQYTDDEQNSHRALAKTIGNLTLLEPDLADRAFDAAFPVKRAVYESSALLFAREVAQHDAWGTASIGARTEELTERFVQVWRRPEVVGIDDDDLTPILDARRRRGWPHGWDREFDYVEYCGEHWEVKDIRYLFHRVFQRLWADARDAVIAYSAQRGGPLYPDMAWQGQWDEIAPGQYLYLGWDSSYMLTAVQGVLEAAGIAGEVFVKYSYIGNAMR